MEINKWTMAKKLNKLIRIEKFNIFDGIRYYDAFLSYNNWFDSFDILQSSYIEVNNAKIYLFKYKYLELSSQYFQEKELEVIANNSGLKIKECNNSTILYTDENLFDTFYYLEKEIDNNLFVVIYSIGGSRYPETIYVHGLWYSKC